MTQEVPLFKIGRDIEFSQARSMRKIAVIVMVVLTLFIMVGSTALYFTIPQLPH